MAKSLKQFMKENKKRIIELLKGSNKKFYISREFNSHPKGSRVRPLPNWKTHDIPGSPIEIKKIGGEHHVRGEITSLGRRTIEHVPVGIINHGNYSGEEHEIETANRLNDYIKKNGGKIKLHIPGFHEEGETITVYHVQHHTGKNKGDISLLDHNGNHIHYIDVKKLQHQGNIGQYDPEHPSVKEVVRLYNETEGKLNRSVNVSGKDPRNRDLIGKALFGNNFGSNEYGINNVQSVITGDIDIHPYGNHHKLVWSGEGHHNKGGEHPDVILRARTSRPEPGRKIKGSPHPGRLQITTVGKK